MKSEPIQKTPTTAVDVCKNFELGKDAQKLLQPGLKPRPFLDVLIAHQLNQDATRFMAFAMARREAIWWACLCARHAYGAAPPAKHAAALQAAEVWTAHPSDDLRRAAFKAAQAAEFNNPAGLIGMAVFFSSGSLGPPGSTEVPPEPPLSQGAAGNAVILSAVLNEPAKAPERYLTFFAQGFDVASGKNRWKERPV